MGDIPPPPGAFNEIPNEDGAPSAFSGPTSSGQPAHHPQNHPGAYQSAGYPSIASQNYAGPQRAFSSQLDMAQSQGLGRGGPYNMSAMANALPQQNYRPAQYPQSQQRFSPPSVSPSAMPTQIPLQQQAYDGQAGINPMANTQYYLPQHAGGMPQYYASSMSPQQLQTNVPPRPSMGYYPSPMVMNQQASVPATYYYAQAGHYSTQAHGMPMQLMQPQYISPTPPQPDPRLAAAVPADQYGTSSYSQDRGSISSDTRQNIVRGPPRKPRQSGHAIWIGNLPPQTDLMSLVHHVCKEAAGLESLFLISKSNCAFANFKDEPTCVSAQQKLHDSKFQSVRLVSRLRKNTVEGAMGVTAPTGPAAGASQAAAAAEEASPQPSIVAESKEAEPTPSTATETKAASATATEAGPAITPAQKDKFFILKSLTMEDLELSVQTGIWATQSHNEDALNKAFTTAENVYLVFSANKSGEYFGYARMTSSINDDPAAAIEFAPKAQASTDLDLPKAIPTEATEFAPKGRIIDDSARGTIFWEAEREESGAPAEAGGGQDGEDGTTTSSGPGSTTGDASSVHSEGGGGGKGGEPKAWGKPFKLEWLSTTRLPFYRTRGLRNPWNSNREVKIARDGTELEPSVGRRLIGLFNRVQSPVPPPAAGAPAVLRGSMPMVPGYPVLRPPPYQP